MEGLRDYSVTKLAHTNTLFYFELYLSLMRDNLEIDFEIESFLDHFGCYD